MMTLLAWLLTALALLILLPVLVLCAQVVLACLPVRARPPLHGPRARVAVLVPAHNEATIILATLDSIRAQLSPGDRLLVVADNCSDDTAALARSVGAEVVERSDEHLRGKGYALDFGIRHLAADAPPVVIVIDADCQVGEGAIDQLALNCIAFARPVQALYLMHAPPACGLKTRIAEFAWRVKNLVRPRGWARLGWPCQLMGSGMAFNWRDLARVDLASGHLVEDLKMGLDLCRNGKPPMFCPEAQVSSYFPANTQGLNSQRKRWEHGHLGVLIGEAPALIVASISGRNWHLLAMTLDLLVPPLALLALLLVVTLSVSGLAWLLFGIVAPALIGAGALLILTATVVLAWSRFCRGLIAFSVLLYAPFYALKKIPLYLGFLIKRQVEWVRSKRDDS